MQLAATSRAKHYKKLESYRIVLISFQRSITASPQSKLGSQRRRLSKLNWLNLFFSDSGKISGATVFGAALSERKSSLLTHFCRSFHCQSRCWALLQCLKVSCPCVGVPLDGSPKLQLAASASIKWHYSFLSSWSQLDLWSKAETVVLESSRVGLNWNLQIRMVNWTNVLWLNGFKTRFELSLISLRINQAKHTKRGEVLMKLVYSLEAEEISQW